MVTFYTSMKFCKACVILYDRLRWPNLALSLCLFKKRDVHTYTWIMMACGAVLNKALMDLCSFRDDGGEAVGCANVERGGWKNV